MNLRVLRIGIIFFAAAMFCTNCTKDEAPASPDGELSALKSAPFVLAPEIASEIDDGIAYLLNTQHPFYGYFSSTYEGVARTALSVTKLCDRSVELGFYPPSTGPYSEAIEKGLNYIFQNAHPLSGDRIYLSTSSGHSVYNTGIAMMALTAARCPECVVEVSCPVQGYTYLEVLEGTLNFFIAAQNPDGGWRYLDQNQPSDNSNTGFAVLGLMAAEGAGLPIPQSLKENLSVYIDFIQNDVSGGSGYVYPNDSWVNTLKTGNLLFEMAFVGDLPDADRVVHAIEYIQTHWNDVGAPSLSAKGWKDNYLAMYCLMKGFVSLNIETITVGGSEVNWYDAFVENILGHSHWPLPAGPWTDPYLSTIFSLLTLEKITPVPYLSVYVDVKPTSCPNPLNRGNMGNIPVAILGTEEFDVTTVDPSTVNIEGVNPLKWSLEDVASPYLGGTSIPINEMDCTTEGPDGFMDLVLHFSSQEIASLFLENVKGDVVVIEVAGQLMDNGLQILGEDYMIIKK